MQKKFQIKICFKIFGIAASLLLLMGLVAYTSQTSLRIVGKEVKDLDQFVIPIANHVGEVAVYTLKQQKHISKILKFNETEYTNPELIAMEKDLLKKTTRQLDQNISKSLLIADEGMKNAKVEINRAKLGKTKSFIKKFEENHRAYYGYAEEMLKMLESGGPGVATEDMEIKLEEKTNTLNQGIEEAVKELDGFMAKTVAVSKSHHQKVMRNGIIITAISFVLGLVFASVVTSAMIRPLKYLTSKTQNFMSEAYIDPIQVKSRDELAELTLVFNHMIDELEEKERLKDTFGKYVDPRIVERLEDRGKGLATTGEKKIVSVLMSNMDGFPLLAASLEPEQHVKLINLYLDILSPSIINKRGFIEFVGTEIKGFWAEPFVSADEHALLSAEAALEQISGLDEFHKGAAELLKDQSGEINSAINRINIHVGIASGPLILANMGPEWAMTYTVMGDTVNTAARLRGVAGQFGARIILLEDTYALVKEKMAARELGLIQVVGKDDKLRIYELLGSREGLKTNREELIKEFAEGLKSYRERDWRRAQEHFHACLDLKPEDGPALKYLNWIEELQSKTLPADWDGVWRLSKKNA